MTRVDGKDSLRVSVAAARTNALGFIASPPTKPTADFESEVCPGGPHGLTAIVQ